MGKGRGSQSENSRRIARCEAYADKVRRMFASAVADIMSLDLTLPDVSDGEMYSFDAEGRKIQAKVDNLLARLHSLVVTAIEGGITLEWEHANAACDKLLQSHFSQAALATARRRGWFARNEAARQAFMQRSVGGLDLSKRIWRSVRQLREEMEVAITVAVGEGADAGTMSRMVRQYLNDPDLMFRRFRYKIGEEVSYDEQGNKVVKAVYGRKWKKRIKDPESGKARFIDYDRDSYHVGRGMYKSAAKNAMRVARTETNMAYRRADHERWLTMPFVLGKRVVLSRSHPKEDICDLLSAPNQREYAPDDKRGVYPKDFLFVGWHPQCFCMTISILVDESEMQKMNEALERGEDYEPRGEMVSEYPSEFKHWLHDNVDRIEDARSRGTEPYFIRDNAKVVDSVLYPPKRKK